MAVKKVNFLTHLCYQDIKTYYFKMQSYIRLIYIMLSALWHCFISNSPNTQHRNGQWWELMFNPLGLMVWFYCYKCTNKCDNKTQCKIWHAHSDAGNDTRLLGYYIMPAGKLLPCWTLKMKALWPFIILVIIYQLIQCNIPKTWIFNIK